MLLDLYRRKNIVLANSLLGIPGLRGAWSAGIKDENGDLFDLTTQIRTLTMNGTPEFNYSSFCPYVALDGTNDYFSRADEAGLDITGTETINAAAVRGLTWGGWFRLNNLTTYHSLMAKYQLTTNNASFISWVDQVADVFIGSISTDGTTLFSVTSSLVHTVNTWYSVIVSFDPSTALNIFVNNVKSSNTTSVPASVFNSSANFRIGWNDDPAGVKLNGDFSLGFLSDQYLSDEIILNFFESTRELFGV